MLESQVDIVSRPEAEAAVLGCMIVDTACIGRAAELVSADDFFCRNNQIIFEGIIEVHLAGGAFDLVLLRDWLQTKGELGDVGASIISKRLLNLCRIARTLSTMLILFA